MVIPQQLAATPIENKHETLAPAGGSSLSLGATSLMAVYGLKSLKWWGLRNDSQNRSRNGDARRSSQRVPKGMRTLAAKQKRSWWKWMVKACMSVLEKWKIEGQLLGLQTPQSITNPPPLRHDMAQNVASTKEHPGRIKSSRRKRNAAVLPA